MMQDSLTGRLPNDGSRARFHVGSILFDGRYHWAIVWIRGDEFACCRAARPLTLVSS